MAKTRIGMRQIECRILIFIKKMHLFQLLERQLIQRIRNFILFTLLNLSIID